MTTWKDATKLLVQVTYIREADGVVYEIRRYLDDWLDDTDGGYASGFAEVAEEFYSGIVDVAYNNFKVDKVEIVDEE